jgi:hypothetical protein
MRRAVAITAGNGALALFNELGRTGSDFVQFFKWLLSFVGE